MVAQSDDEGSQPNPARRCFSFLSQVGLMPERHQWALASLRDQGLTTNRRGQGGNDVWGRQAALFKVLGNTVGGNDDAVRGKGSGDGIQAGGGSIER
jgi:hypothetical protein